MRVTGVVLAGGAGSRLGAFKPLVLVAGETLLSHALDALWPLVDETLVMHGAEANREKLAAYHARAAFAPDPGLGPLGALHAACALARGDWLLVTPCDVPWRGGRALRGLLRAAESHDGASFTHGERWDPLIAAYRREALRRAAGDALAKGERSARRALAHMDLALVPAPADLPGDIDTPADLEQARMRRKR